MANQTESYGGAFIFSDAINSAGQPDDTVALNRQPVGNRETILDDLELMAALQNNPNVWHQNHNADMVDSKHAAYLTTAVNEVDVDHPDLNDTSPAAPSGGLNVKWQKSATQNSDDQTPVSAYVPVSSITTATPAGTDYIVGTDTDDSNNPKRFLVSDITSLVSAAPADAQYVTLATNATLANERVLTAGTGLDLVDAGAGSTVTIDLDLNELTTAAAAALDHLVFVDADDNGTKKTTMADALVALGAQPLDATLTALAAYNTNGLLTQTAADTFVGRTIAVSGDALTITDGDGVAGNPVLAAAADLENIVDVWSVDTSGNVSGIGTLASGAQTITQATVGNVVKTEVSTATNDDPTEKTYHGRTTTTDNGVGTLFTFTPATDKHYAIEATVVVRQTGGTGTGTGRTIKLIADVEDIGGTLTVTSVSSTGAGTLAVFQCQIAVSGTTVVLTCKVEALGGSGYTYVHHAKISLFGPVGS